MLNSNISVYPLGFSHEKTEAYIFHTDKDAALSSIFNRNLNEINANFENKSKIKLTTLDIFCDEENINSIDFLKIDVEGNEYNVLLGAKELLNNKKINVMQFEFGGTCIDARIFFRDFWELLHPTYDIYRINNDSLIEIFNYHV